MNVLMLMVDQHHAGCFGYKGHPDVKTPNIDKLASEGVAFDNAFCQNGICVPSRVSYMTGQYCHTHRVYGNDWDNISERLLSLPHFLQFYGFQTAMIGKKHMPNWPSHGFQYERLCYTADGPTRGIHYLNYLRQHDLFDLYDDLGDVEKFCMTDGKTVPVEHSLENWTADEAIKYLQDERDSEKPFFMQVSFERPHPPLTVPEGCPFEYDPASLTLPENQEEVDMNKTFYFNRNVELKWCTSFHGEAELRRGLANYYSLISLIDWNIGRIMDTLKQNNLTEDTLVIFCADHGDFAGEYSKMAKGWCYDAIHRIPYIWKLPGKIQSSKRLDSLVETVDMFPTICDMLEIPLPKTVQGKSLLPALTKGIEVGKDAVFWEFIGVKTVRTKKWKLNYGWDGEKETGELFNLSADPHEYENKFNDPGCSEIREKLLRKIINWQVETEQPVNFSPTNEKLPSTPWFDGHDSRIN